VPATSFQHMFPDGTNRFYNPVPITPGETLTDPVGKLRVSNPQALIDTDFEYSTQSTKWESLNLLNNRPSASYDVTVPLLVSAVSASTTTITVTLTASLTGTYSQTLTAVTLTIAGHSVQVGQKIYVDYTSGSGVDELVTVTATTTSTISYTSATSIASTSGNVSVTLPPAVGAPIFVQGTTQTVANGWFVVATSPGLTFTYIVASTAGSGSIYDATKTYMYAGNFYTGSGIPLTGTTAFTFSGATITVTTTNAHGLSAGDGIFVVGVTASTNAPNGSFLVKTTPTVNTFTYTASATPTGTLGNTAGSTNLYPRPFGSVIHRSFDGGVSFTAGYPYSGNQLIRQTRRYFRYQSGKGIQFSTGTSLKPAFNVDSITSSGTTVTVNLKNPHNLNGNYLASAGITVSTSAGGAFTYDGTTITCTTVDNHGFSVGDQIFIKSLSGGGAYKPTGTWTVASVLSATQFTFIAGGTPTATITAGAANGTLFPNGTGPFVTVSGCTDAAYNGTFLVQTVPTDTSFTYTSLIAPTTTPDPGFPITISPENWWNARNRIGLFDEQNGFFFEFDGQTLYAVKRSSTTQITGSISVNAGETAVTGASTVFSSQLVPGDAVVIRGMTYNVLSIISDTSMVIYPEYRGTANIANTIVSKRTEERYPQSAWNIDRCDGTGASNFVLNLAKMQMMYIDYAWYGAGAIRFGFKDQKGEIFYAHRIPNSNRNTEAYMRSGNMCARYECNTTPAYTILAADLSDTATDAITVASTAGFPKSGVAVLTKPANTTSGSGSSTVGAIEYIRYNNKTDTKLLGLRRAIASISGPGGLANAGGNSTAQIFTYSTTAPIQVQAYPGQFASTLSHWGSAVIMDGRYDDDKSYIFQAPSTNTTIANLAASASAAILSIRLSPAVDSGLTGILGARDLINRMQLTLRQMDVVTTGTAAIFRVELVLNGKIGGTGAGAFAAAGGSSLAQVATHSTSGTTTVTGGESILSFFAYTPGVVQQELTLVRDLGNSILGGGTTTTVPTSAVNLYPDGPDVVTIKVTNVSAVATNSISARLSWTEAQA